MRERPRAVWVLAWYRASPRGPTPPRCAPLLPALDASVVRPVLTSLLKGDGAASSKDASRASKLLHAIPWHRATAKLGVAGYEARSARRYGFG